MRVCVCVRVREREREREVRSQVGGGEITRVDSVREKEWEEGRERVRKRGGGGGRREGR